MIERVLNQLLFTEYMNTERLAAAMWYVDHMMEFEDKIKITKYIKEEDNWNYRCHKDVTSLLSALNIVDNNKLLEILSEKFGEILLVAEEYGSFMPCILEVVKEGQEYTLAGNNVIILDTDSGEEIKRVPTFCIFDTLSDEHIRDENRRLVYDGIVNLPKKTLEILDEIKGIEPEFALALYHRRGRKETEFSVTQFMKNNGYKYLYQSEWDRDYELRALKKNPKVNNKQKDYVTFKLGALSREELELLANNGSKRGLLFKLYRGKLVLVEDK